jgi:type IV secretory pathway VirJ component
LLAIVLSGDGGWRDLDKTIAENLRDRGVSVVGWDSLRYFWHERTPEELARDLDGVITSHVQKWNARAVGLIGYSFGADVLPFAYNRLPPATRARVKQVSLLGFSPNADFQFHVTAWLGVESSAHALPDRARSGARPFELLQCFYGEDEDDTACPDLKSRGAEVIATSGSHHFDGDYPRLPRASSRACSDARRPIDGSALAAPSVCFARTRAHRSRLFQKPGPPLHGVNPEAHDSPTAARYPCTDGPNHNYYAPSCC